SVIASMLPGAYLGVPTESRRRTGADDISRERTARNAGPRGDRAPGESGGSGEGRAGLAEGVACRPGVRGRAVVPAASGPPRLPARGNPPTPPGTTCPCARRLA